MDRLVGLEVVEVAGVERRADHLSQWHLSQLRLLAAALQEADVVLGRPDQAGPVATAGDRLGVAVVGEDPRRLEREQAIEVAQMGGEALWFVDVGDRVLDGVAGQQEPGPRVPDDGRVVAVDVDLDQLQARLADREVQPSLERPGRHHQRRDRRWALQLAGFDRAALLLEQRGGPRRGDHLAVGEGGGAGDVVEVPVAEQDGDAPHSLALPASSRIRRPCSTETWVS